MPHRDLKKITNTLNWTWKQTRNQASSWHSSPPPKTACAPALCTNCSFKCSSTSPHQVRQLSVKSVIQQTRLRWRFRASPEGKKKGKVGGRNGLPQFSLPFWGDFQEFCTCYACHPVLFAFFF